MLKLVWERWKKVPELKNVKVSSLGRVKINGKIIRPKVNIKGYFVVEYENKFYLVHRLVAKAFLKHNLDKYDTIDHLDQNKRNNSLSNLEIVTEEENLRRANANYIIDLGLGTTDIPDWKIRISDGVHEYRSIAKACNDLVARTNLDRDGAIREVYGSLIFGIKGQRPWKFVKEEK